MRTSAKDQRWTALESDFEPLLIAIACLKECANQPTLGPVWAGNQNLRLRFIGQKRSDSRERAEEVRELRAQFAQPNAMSERFLHCCSERGENLPGEPKRARKFLELIGIDW